MTSTRTAPEGALRTTLPLLMLAAAVAQAFGRFTWAVVLPAVRDTLLGGDNTTAGWLGFANVGAYLAGTLLVTLASKKLRPARMVQMGLASSALGLTVLALAPGFWVLFGGQVLAGLGGAAIWVPAPILAAELAPPAKRGLAVGMVGMGIGLGIFFSTQGIALMRQFTGDQSWRPPWGVEAAIALITLAAVTRWVAPLSTGDPAGRPVRFSSLRSVRGWVPLTASYTAFGLGYVIVLTYVVTMLEDDRGFSTTGATAIFSVMGFATIFGGVTFGRVSDAVGRTHTIRIGFLLLTVCGAAMLFLSGPALWLVAFLFGLSFAGAPTAITAYVADHISPEEFSAAFGVITLAFGVAQIVGPPLGGWLADFTGSFAWAFWVSAAACGLGLVAAMVLPRDANHPIRL